MLAEETAGAKERKLNCWEALHCGHTPWDMAAAGIVCPAALDTAADGLNGGSYAGRICWTVAGTLCFGEVQPSIPRKRSRCQSCGFFRQVRQEEGADFQLIRFPPHPPVEGKEHESFVLLRRVGNNLARLLIDCQDIMRHVEVDALLRTIADQASRACDAERGVIYIFDPVRQHLVARAMSGHGVVGFSVPIADDSIAGYVAKHDTFLSVADTSEELAYIFPALPSDGGFEKQYSFPVSNVLAVPIHGERKSVSGEERSPLGNIIGVIEVLNKQKGSFTEDDEWFLAELAVIAGLALQSAQQFEELRRMRRTDRERSRFVALLMHQIVSPLATVYTCVSALVKLKGRVNSENADALMEGALRKVVMVQELAKKLLDLTAIQDGRALADYQDVDAVAIARTEADNHTEVAGVRDVRLIVDLPATTARVRADPTGLGIVFANLIENAIKYSYPSTAVTLSGRVEKDSFFISVRDTGPGIADEDLSHLFDEFFRCPDATRRGIPGSGLGLTFVKALVSRYGGSIHVDSQSGKGTIFTVSFPCVTAPRSESATVMDES